MESEIQPLAREHFKGFHKVLDAVARERRYLGRFAAPVFEKTKTFLQFVVKNNQPAFVAVNK